MALENFPRFESHFGSTYFSHAPNDNQLGQFVFYLEILYDHRFDTFWQFARLFGHFFMSNAMTLMTMTTCLNGISNTIIISYFFLCHYLIRNCSPPTRKRKRMYSKHLLFNQGPNSVQLYLRSGHINEMFLCSKRFFGLWRKNFIRDKNDNGCWLLLLWSCWPYGWRRSLGERSQSRLFGISMQTVDVNVTPGAWDRESRVSVKINDEK